MSLSLENLRQELHYSSMEETDIKLFTYCRFGRFIQQNPLTASIGIKSQGSGEDLRHGM